MHEYQDSINAAPFSPEFQQSFIDEITASHCLRFGGPGFQGLFDGAGVPTGIAGDAVFHTNLSGAAEMMLAALRALTPAAEVSGAMTRLLSMGLLARTSQKAQLRHRHA